MTGLFDRVVADSANPEEWHAARVGKIGASDAAGFARLSSIEKYVRAKLMPNWFEGNTYTRNGHTWEPTLTEFAGVKHNTLMFRSEEFPEFVATPDGVTRVKPYDHLWVAGHESGWLLSECKIKHKPTYGPTPAERRQIAWAQYVTGATATDFVWLVLDPEDNQPTTLEPSVRRIDRDEALIDKLLTIAHPVLAAMKTAARFEKENS